MHPNNHILPFGIAITVFISSVFNSAFYDNMLGLFLIIIIDSTIQHLTGKNILGYITDGGCRDLDFILKIDL